MRLGHVCLAAWALSCSPAPAAPRPPPPVAASAPAPSPPPSGSVAALPPTPAGLEPSEARLTRLFDRSVHFLVSGEEGRLAALTLEDAVVVPVRFESGKWERLPLPDAHRAVAADPLGIYFGRDNRPRLMGFREAARSMVYLRYKDGRWQDQRTELGALAGRDARLYGVLGEADPEVVCRAEKLCLFKSRKGWQEAKPTIPVDAVVRVFGGRGYALTSDGLFRTSTRGFEAVGPKGPWTTPATGFWISPEGHAVVVEPAHGLLHELDAGAAAWRSTASPLAGPRDVLGPPERRLVVGDGGAARKEGGRWRRLGAATLRLSRALEVPRRAVLGGESGVWALAAD